MANMEATEAAAKIYDLTQAPSESLRAEINESIGQMSGEDRSALTAELVKDNLLPALLLEEMPVLDQDGNGTVEYGELVTNQSTPLAAIAQDFANSNWVGPKEPFGYGNFTDADAQQMAAESPAAVRPDVESDEVVETVEGETPTEVVPDVFPAPRPEWLDLVGRTPEAGELAEINEGSLRPVLLGENNEIIDANPMRADWEYEEAAADPTIQLDVSNPEIVEMQHDITPVSELPTPQSILENPTSTPEQQLQAIKDMVASGTSTTSIVDANGNTINVRMEVVPVAEGSDRSFVHMFAVDPTTGTEMPVLRAISDGDTFEHQRTADGEEVSFVGTKWKKAHPDTMFGED